MGLRTVFPHSSFICALEKTFGMREDGRRVLRVRSQSPDVEFTKQLCMKDAGTRSALDPEPCPSASHLSSLQPPWHTAAGSPGPCFSSGIDSDQVPLR